MDVGANIGNHTIFAAGVVGRRVIAYEPNPDIFVSLQHNITVNRLTKRVLAKRLGLGTAGCHARLIPGDATNSGASRLEKGSDGEITLSSLDEERNGNGQRVAVLKIDVEGMEAEVLCGAGRLLESDGPLVFAESLTDQTTAILTDLMAGYGYACAGMVSGTEMLEFTPRNRPSR